MGVSNNRDETGEGKTGDADRDQLLWVVLYGLIALSLWAQWLGPGLVAELRSEDGSDLALLCQFLPIAAIGVGALWHHPAGRLALVPISFLPGLALLPGAEWEALGSPVSLLLVLATLLLYLFVAASRPDEMPDRAGAVRDIDGENDDRQAAHFRRFVATRFGVAAVLFGVITYGLFFDLGIQRSFAALDGETERRTQQVITAVSTYFGWMIAVYTAAVLPALNWEHHRRRSPVPEKQIRLLADSRRLGRRVVVWLGCLLIMTLVSFWWLN